jgi:uncharacterized membrane protein
MDRVKLKSISAQQVRSNLLHLFLCAAIIGGVSYLLRSPSLNDMNAIIESYYERLARGGFDTALEIHRFFSAARIRAMSVVLSVLVLVIVPALELGVMRVILNVSRGGNASVKDISFGVSHWGKSVVLNFVIELFVSLWSILFIIPGIVASVAYSMSWFIMADNPGMSVLAAISESKRITKGHKAELFILQLSFIGWFIFGSITLGFGYLYVYPYYFTTYANAYNLLKNNNPVNKNNTTNPPTDEDREKDIMGI